ncbi:MAG: hypothetical protein AB1664_16180 [Thermodesulfobacteriota bacterium]
MSALRCHRCGQILPEGSLKYQVDVRVRSLYDGTIPEQNEEDTRRALDKVLAELSHYNEEQANREVYEDDVFVLCPPCKEEFLQDIYAHMHPKASPELGRDHLIH